MKFVIHVADFHVSISGNECFGIGQRTHSFVGFVVGMLRRHHTFVVIEEVWPMEKCRKRGFMVLLPPDDRSVVAP